MHKLFPEWYRVCNPQCLDKTLNSRWAVSQAIKKYITAENALEMLNLYLQKGHQQFTEEVVDICIKKDTAFPARKNQVELSILIGVAIIDIFENENSTRGDILSVSCLTYDCCGSRSLGLMPDVLQSARNYLSRRCKSLRNDEAVTKISTSTWSIKEEVESIVESLADGVATDNGQEFKAAFEKLYAIVKVVARDTNRIVVDVNKALQHRREESDVLWWLLPGYLDELDLQVSALSQHDVVLVIGAELSSKILSLPGPLSAKAFLGKMISYADRVDADLTINKAIINENNSKWRLKVSELFHDVSPSYSPILYGVCKSVELNDANGWAQLFEATTSISAESIVTPLDVSYQVYLEYILLKLLGQVSK